MYVEAWQAWLLLIGASIAYIARYLVAHFRRHPNTLWIWALNFFLGWTGVGWILSLLWALSTPRPTVTLELNLAGSPLLRECPACKWFEPEGASFCSRCGASLNVLPPAP